MKGAEILTRLLLPRHDWSDIGEKLAPAPGPSPSSARDGPAATEKTWPSLVAQSHEQRGGSGTAPCSFAHASSGRRLRRRGSQSGLSRGDSPGAGGVSRRRSWVTSMEGRNRHLGETARNPQRRPVLPGAAGRRVPTREIPTAPGRVSRQYHFHRYELAGASLPAGSFWRPFATRRARRSNAR